MLLFSFIHELKGLPPFKSTLLMQGYSFQLDCDQ